MSNDDKKNFIQALNVAIKQLTTGSVSDETTSFPSGKNLAICVWNESDEATFMNWASKFMYYSYYEDELYENAVEKRRREVFPELDKVVCSDVAGLITEFVGYE